MIRPALMLAILGGALVIAGLAGNEFLPQPRPSVDAAVRGKALFAAKGCSTCHYHAAVAGSGRIESGPNLSHTTLPPAYLGRWLANPPAIRPGTRMPQLGLAPDEISALVAFLTAQQP